MGATAFSSSADLPVASEENNGVKLNPAFEEDEFRMGNAPLKYIPLCDVYSATSPCVTANGSKKVKAAARKPPQINGHDHHPVTEERLYGLCYSRRSKVKEKKSPFMDGLVFQDTALNAEGLEVDEEGVGSAIKRRRVDGRTELTKSRNDFKSSSKLDDQNLLGDGFDKINSKNAKESGNANCIATNCKTKKRKNDCLGTALKNSEAFRTKKWVWYVLFFFQFK